MLLYDDRIGLTHHERHELALLAGADVVTVYTREEFQDLIHAAMVRLPDRYGGASAGLARRLLASYLLDSDPASFTAGSPLAWCQPSGDLA